MPIESYLPIRVVVDPPALATRLSEIEAAVEAALGRALNTSLEQVVAPRGGYLGVALSRPDFNWSGDGLGEVSSRQRLVLEQRINDLVDAAVEESGLLVAARASLEAPMPLSADSRDALDSNRLYRLLQLYRVPSYEDAGTSANVPVEPPADEEEDRPRGIPVEAWSWLPHREIFADDEGGRRWRDLLVRRLYPEAVRKFGAPTGGAWIGLMWQDADVLVAQFTSRDGNDDSYRYITFPVTNFGVWEFMGEDVDPPWQFKTGLPDPAPASMRLRGRFSADQGEKAVREVMGKGLLADIRKHARRPPNTTDAEIEPQIQRAYEIEIQRRAREMLRDFNGDFVLLELQIGPSTFYVPVPPEDLWEGEVKLLPVTFTEYIVPGQEGEGKGAGARGERDGEGGDGTSGDDRAGAGDAAGGIVHAAAEATVAGGRVFVPSPGGTTLTLECDAFLGEPSLDELGSDGERLQLQIDEIASRLGMPSCSFAGRFCLNAAQAAAGRAFAVGEFAVTSEADRLGFSQPPPPEGGNLGLLQFTPVASPAIQFLRHFAQLVPMINRLASSANSVYLRHPKRIRGTWHDRPYSWMLRFGYDFNRNISSAAQILFIMTCRVLMLQLLQTSRKGITDRLENFETYAPIFERLVVTQLTDLDELRRLRVSLDVEINASAAGAAGRYAFESWRDSHRALEDVFSGVSPFRGDGGGKFVRQDGKVVAVRDSRGSAWSLTELQQAIAIREGVAEGIDPLVKQIADVKGMIHRFERDPSAIRNELRRLLNEMRAANEAVTSEVKGDWREAFKTGRIAHDIPSATIPGTQFALQGIHLQAHHMIGEFFQGDVSYPIAVNLLLKGEHTLEIVYEAFTFVGLTLLAVVCVPLAVAAGVGLGVYEHYKAGEREELMRALLDPELVVTRAEIEAAYFAAELGIALSFVPFAGRILRIGARGTASALRQGARATAREAAERTARIYTRSGLQSAGRSLRDRFSKQMAEQLKDGLAVALVREIVSDQLMDQLLTRMLFGPALEQIQREYQDFAVSATTLRGDAPRPLPPASAEEILEEK